MKKIVIAVLLISICCFFGCAKTEGSQTDNTTQVNSGTIENDKTEAQNTADGLLIHNDSSAYEYAEVEGGIEIVAFNNFDYIEYDKIIVPAEIDGKNVIGIGSKENPVRVMDAIFGNCEVVIPSTIEYIAKEAFNGAKGLVKLSGGENCKEFEENAFFGCINLKEITFIDSVEVIHEWAFAACTTWHELHPEYKA